jgi:hypothetical protein
MQDYVEKQVNECLDPNQSYLNQKPSALGRVREAVRNSNLHQNYN